MNIQEIEAQLQPLRKKLEQHPVYEQLSSMADIRLFMQQHVYAVWDFMSLAKALQIQLTCTTVPWVPPSHPTLARFINEIIWAEESDVNETQEAQSHFGMYLEAMQEVGADVQPMHAFIADIKAGKSVREALIAVNAPQAVADFVNFTFTVIASGESHKIAAAFTFGREDLIPDMFIQIIKQSSANAQREQYHKLTYYLQRHIDLDGDEHGPLAMQMIRALCGGDAKKWQEVLVVSKKALQKRLQLWTSIEKAIVQQKQLTSV